MRDSESGERSSGLKDGGPVGREAPLPGSIPAAAAPARIQKILSDYGIASRRDAERMILAGRVTVNGIPAVPGQKAQPGPDEVAIDGRLLPDRDKKVYILLNKPRGYVTTMNDERGRKTVVELVKDVQARVYPVGRLDMDTEGMLLMTNDGEFANAVAHPSNNTTKTYEVCADGDVRAALDILEKPMEIDMVTVCAAEAGLIERSRGGGMLRISVCEGRNRQIRKMCAKAGLEVRTLKRVSIGALELGSLKTGQWRYLTREEVEYFG